MIMKIKKAILLFLLIPISYQLRVKLFCYENCDQREKGLANPNLRIVLFASCSGEECPDVKYQWSLIRTLGNTKESLEDDDATGFTEKKFIIKPNVLVSGEVYRILLKGVVSSEPNKKISTILTINMGVCSKRRPCVKKFDSSVDYAGDITFEEEMSALNEDNLKIKAEEYLALLQTVDKENKLYLQFRKEYLIILKAFPGFKGLIQLQKFIEEENIQFEPGATKIVTDIVTQTSKLMIDKAASGDFTSDVVLSKSQELLGYIRRTVNTSEAQIGGVSLEYVNETTDAPYHHDIFKEEYPVYDYFDLESIADNIIQTIENVGDSVLYTMGNNSEHTMIKDDVCLLSVKSESSNIEEKKYDLCERIIYISDELAKELSSKMKVMSLNFAVLMSNYLWWTTENMSIYTVSIRIKNFETKKALESLENPINIHTKVNHEKSEYVKHALCLTPNITMATLPDEYIPVLQLKPEEYDIKYILLEFTDMQPEDKIRVVVMENMRPVVADFTHAFTVGVKSNYYQHRLNLNKDDFAYVGLLPNEDTFKSSGSQYGEKKCYNMTVRISRISCDIWSRTNYEWESQYCFVDANTTNTDVICSCLHASLFMTSSKNVKSAIVKDWVIPINITSEINFVVLIALAVVLLVFALAFLIAYFRQKKLARKKRVIYLYDNNMTCERRYLICVYTGTTTYAGTTANVGIKVYGTLADSDRHILRGFYEPVLQRGNEDWFYLLTYDLGDVTKLELWTDCHGINKSWYCKRVLVYSIDQDQIWVFEVHEWLSVLNNNTFNRYFVKTVTPKKSILQFAYIGLLRHLWTSPFKRIGTHQFSWYDRLLLMLLIVMLCMLFSILILGVPSPQIYGQFGRGHFEYGWYEFGLSALVGFVVFAISAILIFLNKTTRKLPVLKSVQIEGSYQRFVRCLLYPLIVVTLILLNYFGLWFNYKSSLVWIPLFLIAVIFCIVFEIIRVMLIAIILRQLKPTYLSKLDLASVHYQQEKVFRHFREKGMRPFFRKYYMPISRVDKKIKRDKELTRIELRNIFADVTMYVIYMIVLFFVVLLNKDPMGIKLSQNVEDIFIHDKYLREAKFYQINSKEGLAYYIRQVFLPAIYATKWYGKMTSSEAGLLVDFNTKLLGVPRVRQHRVRRKSCGVFHYTFAEHDMAELNLPCHSEFGTSVMDTGAYSTSWNPKHDVPKGSFEARTSGIWAYQTSSQSRSGAVYGRINTYPGGGYVTNFGRNIQNSLLVLNYLLKTDWIDQRTRGLFFEVYFYNANQNLFCLLTLVVEITAAGHFVNSYRLRVSKFLFLYDELAIATFVCFLMLMAMIFAFSIRKYQQLKVDVIHFFRQTWNIIDVVIIFNAFGFILGYFIRDVVVSKLVEELEESAHNKFVSFNNALFWDDAVTILATLLVAISTVRLWKLLRFVKMFRVCELTLLLSSKFLFGIAFIAITLLYAYCVFAFVIFGPYSNNFKSVSESFLTLIVYCSGFQVDLDYPIFHKIIWGIGYLFYVFYLLILIFVLNIFVTIIIVGYESSKHYYDESEREKLYAYNLKEFIVEEFQITFAKDRGRKFHTHLPAGGQEIVVEDQYIELRKDVHRKEVRINRERMLRLHLIVQGIIFIEYERRIFKRKPPVSDYTDFVSVIIEQLIDDEYETFRNKEDDDVYIVIQEDEVYKYIAKQRIADMYIIVEYLLRKTDIKEQGKEPMTSELEDQTGAALSAMNAKTKKVIKSLGKVTSKVYMNKGTNVTFEDLGLLEIDEEIEKKLKKIQGEDESAESFSEEEIKMENIEVEGEQDEFAEKDATQERDVEEEIIAEYLVPCDRLCSSKSCLHLPDTGQPVQIKPRKTPQTGKSDKVNVEEIDEDDINLEHLEPCKRLCLSQSCRHLPDTGKPVKIIPKKTPGTKKEDSAKDETTEGEEEVEDELILETLVPCKRLCLSRSCQHLPDTGKPVKIKTKTTPDTEKEDEQTVKKDETTESKDAVSGSSLTAAKNNENIFDDKDSARDKETVEEDKDVLTNSSLRTSKDNKATKDTIEEKYSDKDEETVEKVEAAEYKNTLSRSNLRTSKDKTVTKDTTDDKDSSKDKETERKDETAEYKDALSKSSLIASKDKAIKDSVDKKDSGIDKDRVEKDESAEYKEVVSRKSLRASVDKATKDSIDNKDLGKDKEIVGKVEAADYKEVLSESNIRASKDKTIKDNIDNKDKETVEKDEADEYKEALSKSSLRASKEKETKDTIDDKYTGKEKKIEEKDEATEYREASKDKTIKDSIDNKDSGKDKETVEKEEAADSTEVLLGSSLRASKDKTTKDTIDDKTDEGDKYKDELSRSSLRTSKDNKATKSSVDNKDSGKKKETVEKDEAEALSKSSLRASKDKASKDTIDDKDTGKDKQLVEKDEAAEYKEALPRSSLKTSTDKATKDFIENEDTDEDKKTLEKDEAEESKKAMSKSSLRASKDKATKNSIKNKDTGKNKETAEKDETVESKKALSRSSLRSSKDKKGIKDSIDNKDLDKGKETVEKTEAEEYKEALSKSSLRDSKDKAIKDSIENKDIGKDKETMEEDEAAESKKPLSKSSLKASKDKATKNSIENKDKGTMEKDEAAKSKEALSRSSLKASKNKTTRISIENKDTDKETVEKDEAVEYKETFSRSSLKASKDKTSKNTIETKDTDKYKETEEKDEGAESKEALPRSSLKASKDKVTKDSIENKDIGNTKETEEKNEVVISKEALSRSSLRASKDKATEDSNENKDIGKDKETVENDEAVISKEALSKSSLRASKDKATKDSIANKDIDKDKETMKKDEAAESKEALSKSSLRASKDKATKDFIDNMDSSKDKETMEKGEAAESKDALSKISLRASKDKAIEDTIENKDIGNDEETVEKDEPVESKKALSKSSLRASKDKASKDFIENKDSSKDKETMEKGEAAESKDALSKISLRASKDKATKDSIAYKDIDKDKETVKKDEAAEYKDTVPRSSLKSLKDNEATKGSIDSKDEPSKYKDALSRSSLIVSKDKAIKDSVGYKDAGKNKETVEKDEATEDKVIVTSSGLRASKDKKITKDTIDDKDSGVGKKIVHKDERKIEDEYKDVTSLMYDKANKDKNKTISVIDEGISSVIDDSKQKIVRCRRLCSSPSCQHFAGTGKPVLKNTGYDKILQTEVKDKMITRKEESFAKKKKICANEACTSKVCPQKMSLHKDITSSTSIVKAESPDKDTMSVTEERISEDQISISKESKISKDIGISAKIKRRSSLKRDKSIKNSNTTTVKNITPLETSDTDQEKNETTTEGESTSEKNKFCESKKCTTTICPRNMPLVKDIYKEEVKDNNSEPRKRNLMEEKSVSTIVNKGISAKIKPKSSLKRARLDRESIGTSAEDDTNLETNKLTEDKNKTTPRKDKSTQENKSCKNKECTTICPHSANVNKDSALNTSTTADTAGEHQILGTKKRVSIQDTLNIKKVKTTVDKGISVSIKRKSALKRDTSIRESSNTLVENETKSVSNASTSADTTEEHHILGSKKRVSIQDKLVVKKGRTTVDKGISVSIQRKSALKKDTSNRGSYNTLAGNETTSESSKIISKAKNENEIKQKEDKTSETGTNASVNTETQERSRPKKTVTIQEKLTTHSATGKDERTSEKFDTIQKEQEKTSEICQATKCISTKYSPVQKAEKIVFEEDKGTQENKRFPETSKRTPEKDIINLETDKSGEKTESVLEQTEENVNTTAKKDRVCRSPECASTCSQTCSKLDKTTAVQIEVNESENTSKETNQIPEKVGLIKVDEAVIEDKINKESERDVDTIQQNDETIQQNDETIRQNDKTTRKNDKTTH